MSMLAEPRRKQKIINLRAKNNAWSNDNTKFGQRMLEKMGWTAGKGLGAQENGIVEHVVAKYKNDERGLGFEDKNDQWTKHEDDFNALLANLSNAGEYEGKLHSGISLEVKSKKSKARIHYHKFTRGKDLSRYSEKDLANIFGKKSFKIEEKEIEVLIDKKVEETEQLFTERGSMEDYFKNKLSTIKNTTNVTLNNGETNRDDEAEYGFQGFSNNSSQSEETHEDYGFQSFSFYSKPALNGKSIESGKCDVTNSSNDKQERKKKKKAKNEESNENIYEEDSLQCKRNKKKHISNGEVNLLNEMESSIEKVKKRKKEKQEQQLIQEQTEYQPKKEKSKNKHISYENPHMEESVSENIQVPKKKKKKKNKDNEN